MESFGGVPEEKKPQTKEEIVRAQEAYVHIRYSELFADGVSEGLKVEDLDEKQRKALREILIQSGTKLNMYKQFQESIEEGTEKEAKVIEMKHFDEDDESGEFREAI